METKIYGKAYVDQGILKQNIESTLESSEYVFDLDIGEFENHSITQDEYHFNLKHNHMNVPFIAYIEETSVGMDAVEVEAIEFFAESEDIVDISSIRKQLIQILEQIHPLNKKSKYRRLELDVKYTENTYL